MLTFYRNFMDGNQKKKRLFLFCILLIITLIVLHIACPADLRIEGVKGTNTSEVLHNSEVLTQPLSVTRPISRFSFKIGTFLQEIENGMLRVDVLDKETGEVLHSRIFDAAQLTDNSSLQIEANLPQGEFLVLFDLENLSEEDNIAFYSCAAFNNNCSIDGVTQKYAIKLNVNYQFDFTYYASIFRTTCIVILAVLAICFIVNDIVMTRKKKGLTKQIIFRDIAAYCCIFLAMALLYISYREMLAAGKISFLPDNRVRFYAIVLLVFSFIWLVSDKKAWIGYLFISLLAIVWIFTDLEYSVIDESAHTDIIRFIINHNYIHFPRVYDNYEAIQGPVYYFVAAILFGWLPGQYLYLAVRLFGLLLLAVFGWYSKKTLNVLQKAGNIRVPERVMNVFLLLFVFNPNVLIRLTRVSNEPLVCVIVSVVVFRFTKMTLEGFNRNKVTFITILCALAFLTKSTSVVVFGLVFLLCAYYKKWKTFFVQTGLFVLILAPWFINNLRIYGALTGMEGHLAYVMPFANPDMIKPDIWRELLYYFNSYFINPESGMWYDYKVTEEFTRTVLLVLLVVSAALSIGVFIRYIRKKLKFEYKSGEKKEILFLSYTALPLVTIIMHAVQTLMTYNNTLGVNRYCFMLNGVFCGMFMIGMSALSERAKKYISVIAGILFAVFTVSMICGYVEIASSGVF